MTKRKIPEPEKISITQEELAAMIRNGVAAERQNTVFNKRVKPYFVAAWNSRFVWFVAGFLICATIFPFAEGGIPVIRLTPDSPQAIAADAPNATDSDHRKRQTIATAYRLVADRIKSGTITTPEEAFAALTIETANALSAPTWKKTTTRLEAYLKTANDLESLSDKLYEIVDNGQWVVGE